MIAVSVHQIGVILHKLDLNLHKSDGITEWTPPKSDEIYWDGNPGEPILTLLQHPWYSDHNQYPNGIADSVGYWAENRILGGVVLFDRSTAPGRNADAIYFHSDRRHITYRIYQLLPEQKLALLNFLTAEPAPEKSPLPILGDLKNLDRIDPEEPHGITKVYRDIWERKDFPLGTYDERMKDVWDKLNFPTWRDKMEASRRSRKRKEKYYASISGSLTPESVSESDPELDPLFLEF